MSETVEIGHKAPSFTLPCDGGGTVSLAELAGRNVVLYLYPKDDTSGCTREALDFSARLHDFEAANTTVIGVSKDSVASHGKFREKHSLGVILASDESGGLVEGLGAWVEKSMYGRRYMGTDRATFLIDGQGVIRQIWRKVKVPGHAEDVLAAARRLAAEPSVR
jgi:thioredoxin-dependent peroxiredoxin